MSMRRTVTIGLDRLGRRDQRASWWPEPRLFDPASRQELHGDTPFRVGFIPVTCHLTCPVTHFINDQMSGDGLFEPIRFSGWPELKETFLANDLEATFHPRAPGHVASRAGSADQDRLPRPP